MKKTRVGIINVTGYTGVELARLLARHPQVELASVTGRSAAGQKLSAVFPHLAGLELDIDSELANVDIVFSAMPHKDSTAEVLPRLDRGIRVIDLSADFRLKDAAEYQSWYGLRHPAPDKLQEAVYGLPELHRAEIKEAKLVANPGCYPTAAILALAPAVKEGLITPDIIVDSKSGVSGAGRTLSLKTHFSEANEDVAAYALDGHRHLPEIEQELGLLHPGQPPRITFVPHLIPMDRGILTTSYAHLSPGASKNEAEVGQLYADFYRDEPFVRVVAEPPHTKHTSGSNFCFIYPTVDRRTGRLVVVSCIDNLVKGAGGQAIQNMNIMLGFPETAGLEVLPVYP